MNDINWVFWVLGAIVGFLLVKSLLKIVKRIFRQDQERERNRTPLSRPTESLPDGLEWMCSGVPPTYKLIPATPARLKEEGPGHRFMYLGIWFLLTGCMNDPEKNRIIVTCYEFNPNGSQKRTDREFELFIPYDTQGLYLATNGMTGQLLTKRPV